MTQTITVQKGSVSSSWDNSTLTTIFSLSSGTASRVILNNISAYQNSGNPETGTMWFSVYNSTTGLRNIIGGVHFYTSSLACTSFTILPNDMSGSKSTQYNTGLLYNNGSYLWCNNGATSMGAVAPSLIAFKQSENTNQTGVYFPSQFWMTNGDSLQVKGFWNGTSGQVIYSFTVITES